MTTQIFTRKEALRYAARRVAVAVPLTFAISWVMVALQFGTDPTASVRVGFVTLSVIATGLIVSSFLTGAMAYYSALVMRELTLARAELLRISRTDPLTGMLNRRGFDEAATAELIKAKELNVPVVAFMCDIDRFKSINDQYGHEFGDKVLIQLGDILRSFATEADILVARHGGEEFAALVVGINNEQALLYAETLRRLCATEVSTESGSTNVTVSVGLTSPEWEIDLATVIRYADQALYEAKNSGRNRVAQANAMMEVIASKRHALSG